jgi:hypothetical protein
LACISYTKLQASTNGFSTENLINLGSFGYEYKEFISTSGAIVAVKALNLQH